MNCCNVECDTPYCPQCGKPVLPKQSGAYGLHRHILNHVKQAEKLVERRKARNLDYTTQERRLAKWQSWERVVAPLCDPT